MRIIAGEWRGRRLTAPPGEVTRPTADRTRETLFNMLASRLGSFEGVNVVDLFAGSGALGLEALSRGAASCLFVEQDADAVKSIRKNIESLDARTRTTVQQASVMSLGPAKAPHDLILLDPPYDTGAGHVAIDRLTRLGWIGPATWVALETGAKEERELRGLEVVADRKMGKAKVIAETGAGQHGVATATVCARFGLQCVVYMGAHDCDRQRLNVFRMRMLGAEVVPVEAGQKTLKEAVNEAMRDWVTNVRSTHYILGTAYGAHPYPVMVRNFHRVIGDEARRQILEQEERLPDLLTACVGGGSNAIGLFYPFIEDESVSMVGVEAGGEGIIPEKHAARFQGGSLGVLQGTRSYLLQDEVGQIQMTHSVSAGLDYAAVGPEHAWLRDQGRVEYTYATDDQALEAFFRLSKLEGIIPALESSHAVAEVIVRAPQMSKDQIIICNLSGRGDKDVQQVAEKVEM